MEGIILCADRYFSPLQHSHLVLSGLWLSGCFLVQVYDVQAQVRRLSISGSSYTLFIHIPIQCDVLEKLHCDTAYVGLAMRSVFVVKLC